MQILIFFIVLKIVLTVAFIMGCTWLIAEFFPIIAHKMIEVSSGTSVDFVGEWLAKAFNAIARFAAKFFNIMVEWLQVLGIDFEKFKSTIEDADTEKLAADASF